MKKLVEIQRLNRGDEFEFKGEKYVVFNTIVGFGTEVVAKSLKKGDSIRIHKTQKVLVG